MIFDFKVIFENFDFYLSGMLMTLLLTVTSLLIGLFIALIFAIIKYQNKHKITIKIINTIVFYFRGTPCLLQIYLIYYGLAQFQFVKDSFLWLALENAVFCVMLALTLNTASYTTEIIYGGIKATPKTQIEAVQAFGFSFFSGLLHIILPGVIRRIIPFYANESVFLMQATALASTITVVELTQVARIINSRFFIPFEAFLFAALFYMLISYVIFYSLSLLERKLNKI